MVDNSKSSKLFRAIVGVLLMCFGVAAPLLVSGQYSLYINTICIVAVIGAAVMIIPFVTKLMIGLLGRLYAVGFGNIGTIAVKNLRENRSVNGSIALLTIGIASVLFVNTLSNSSLTELINFYDRNTYDLYMSAQGVDQAYLQSIGATEGVKEVAKVMGIGGIEIVNKGDSINLVQGVDVKNYLSYNNLPLKGNRQELLELLEKGRGILVTNQLKNRYGLKLGEELQLRAWGNSSSYTIVGFFNSIESNGSYAIISEKYMRLDMGWEDGFYSTLLIKTEGDPDKAMENLRTRFAKQQPYITTVKDMKLENIRYNEQLFLIAKGFSIITMLAGILGIFNNLIIGFLQRKRQLAMYRSIGMSKIQMMQMIFIEAITMGFIGSVMGVISGILMILSGAGLLKSLEMEMTIHYSGVQLELCILLGISITVIASLWPALKSSKLNLMEAIKYE